MSKKTEDGPKPTPLLDALAKDMATQDSQDIREANDAFMLERYGMTYHEWLESPSVEKTAEVVLKDFDGGNKEPPVKVP